jgi:hypothetical protein
VSVPEIDAAPAEPFHAIQLRSPAFPLAIGRYARDWMDASPERYANRCLPLLIANQHGWDVMHDGHVAMTWNGGRAPRDLTLSVVDGKTPSEMPVSHFGDGIVTWKLPYLFRTPPGWNLLARGPVNDPKDGISALEGMIETDWCDAPFTMNWKLTRPGHTVVFEAGEVICRIVPVRRGALEAFDPSIHALADADDIAPGFPAWSASREAFARERRERIGWQKHYLLGEAPDGTSAPEHQTRLHLRDFRAAAES